MSKAVFVAKANILKVDGNGLSELDSMLMKTDPYKVVRRVSLTEEAKGPNLILWEQVTTGEGISHPRNRFHMVEIEEAGKYPGGIEGVYYTHLAKFPTKEDRAKADEFFDAYLAKLEVKSDKLSLEEVEKERQAKAQAEIDRVKAELEEEERLMAQLEEEEAAKNAPEPEKVPVIAKQPTKEERKSKKAGK